VNSGADPDSLFRRSNLRLAQVYFAGFGGFAPPVRCRALSLVRGGKAPLKLTRFQQLSNTLCGNNIWLNSYNIVDQVEDICVRNT